MADQNQLLAAYSQIIGTIRTVDPDKIVLVEPSGGNANIAGAFANFNFLTDKRNVVWSLHLYYGGGDADGYDANGNPTGVQVSNGTTGYTFTDRATAKAQLEACLNVHRTKLSGVLPIWVGEMGIGSGATNRDLWIDDWVAEYDKFSLGFAWWEYFTGGGTGAFSAINASLAWNSWIAGLFPAAPTIPNPPTNFSANPGSGSATASWTASTSTDVVQYRVEKLVGASFVQAAVVSAPATSASIGGLTNGTTYTLRCIAISPTLESSPSNTDTVTPTAGGGATFDIIAAGDFQNSPQFAVGNQVKAITGATWIALGDDSYSHDYGTYDNAFGASNLSRSWIVPGNHDMDEGGSASTFFNHFGDRTGTVGSKGYGSADLGSLWKLIWLNAEIGLKYYQSHSPYDQAPGRLAMMSWAQTEINNAKAAGKLICMAWHHPRWALSALHASSEGQGTASDLWSFACNNGVKFTLHGHAHNFEVFKPMNAAGGFDANGTQEFIVGTGGAGSYGITSPNSSQPGDANFQAGFSADTHHGLIKFALKSNGYHWDFITDNGTILGGQFSGDRTF